MKRLRFLILISAAVCAHIVTAQHVTIPDVNFRVALQRLYPSCFSVNGQMDIACSLILNETELEVSGSQISNLEGIQYFKNLLVLNCSSNRLTSLPALPISLQVLRCDYNRLTSLPALPISLKRLDCNINQITSLPDLPDSMRMLTCINNQLTTIPDLPDYLEGISCTNNQLTELPALPNSLIDLVCDSNKLTSLPILPNSISFIFCQSNQLAYLPPLPKSLKYFHCYNNQITDMPSIPDSLQEFHCYNNQLSSLPPLPNSLQTFTCYNNKLTSLPDLPTQLRFFRCFDNQLTSLPALPNSLYELFCHNNLINCLPYLPVEVAHLSIDEEKISCIPNSPNTYLTIYNSLNKKISKPICSIANNINQCEVFPLISGTVYYDMNKDGIRQNDELPKSNIKVILSNEAYTFTDDHGHYEISTLALNTPVTVRFVSPVHYKALPDSASFTFKTYSEQVQQDIALQPTISLEDMKLVLTSTRAARPGFDYSYQLDYENMGTTTLSPIITVDYDENILSYDFSTVAGMDNGSLLSYNDLPIMPPGTKRKILINFKIKTNANLGDQLCVYGNYQAGAARGEESSCMRITGSHDPNDKQAIPFLSPAQVGNEYPIEYNVRFQNTGTDTAFTVVITDHLSAYLQTNTLEMLSSSHNCNVKVLGNIVYFEFQNILLPDSNTNEAASHGYVRFKVRPHPHLVIGDRIDNEAYIYFDYNNPIITNTVTTFIKDPSVTNINDVTLPQKMYVYPNPARTLIYVSDEKCTEIKIMNALGLEVLHVFSRANEAIDINHLERGLYFYNINGQEKGKIIVE